MEHAYAEDVEQLAIRVGAEEVQVLEGLGDAGDEPGDADEKEDGAKTKARICASERCSVEVRLSALLLKTPKAAGMKPVSLREKDHPPGTRDAEPPLYLYTAQGLNRPTGRLFAAWPPAGRHG